LIYKEEAFAIVGACFEVYNQIGCGFLEAVYQECLEIELALQGIPFQPQQELALTYKGKTLAKTYQPEFYLFREDHRRDQSGVGPVRRAPGAGSQLPQGNWASARSARELRQVPQATARAHRPLIVFHSCYSCYSW
jgi:hypothetical protein